jgi:ribonuclease BN (tRNA processing enzyme)
MCTPTSVLTLVLTLLCTISYANQCEVDQVKLQVLGSGGPELDDSRHASGYLIGYRNKAQVLIDAGADSSIEYGKSGATFEDLQDILLTHLHVDHSADLPAFITGSCFTARNANLSLYGSDKNSLMPSTSQSAKVNGR